jgi:hypothetical protein
VIKLAVALAALLELGLARLFPETGGGLYLRLGAATIVVLLPGGLIAEALGRRSTSATLVWALVATAVALAVTFAVEGSLTLTLVLLGVIAVTALLFAARRGPVERRTRGSILVLVAGAAFGLALWHVAGHVDGDGLFHVARVRKLDAFGSLSLHRVDEFVDGGLHPGYAFPLWHGFLALVTRLAGVDPSAVVLHEPSVLAPVAFVVSYEAGVALFRSAFAGVAVVCAQVAMVALAPGHGGSYAVLDLPATAARQLLVPAVLALAFSYVAAPSRTLLASAAAGGLALAFVHPTYAVFVLVPLAGFALTRALLARTDLPRAGSVVAAIAVPTAAVLVWLLPVVRDTASHNPSPAELERAVAHYGRQLRFHSEHNYRLAPEVFGRAGAVAVAALCLVPLAGLAARRRWAAFVLGGSLPILALTLTPFLFPWLADLVSLSQARRLAGFLPFAFALAGGLVVLARLLGVVVLPVALVAGLILQRAYPGDFGYVFEEGGPAFATWIAAAGGTAALLFGLVSGRLQLERRGVLAGLAIALFVLPVAWHGFGRWSPSTSRRPSPLTPGLVAALRKDVPEGGVVFSDLETSYRVAAAAPLYVAAAPPAHVADTRENRPYERRRDVLRFYHLGDLAIPRRYRAGWIVVDRSRFRLSLPLPRLYADSRYVLYRSV